MSGRKSCSGTALSLPSRNLTTAIVRFANASRPRTFGKRPSRLSTAIGQVVAKEFPLGKLATDFKNEQAGARPSSSLPL